MSSLKVLSFPHISKVNPNAGIGQVIQSYFRYLPQFGIEMVDHSTPSYDIRVSHAGSITDADVAHNHGMYWTADYPASDAEYSTNANVISAIRHAKQVTVPSSWVAEVFQRDMRFTPHVVPHGIDWDNWQRPTSDEGYVIGYNKNRNGIDVCDSSVADRLAANSPDIKFINTFAHSNHPDNISLTGVIPHPQMKSLIQECSVYVSTIKETGGIGILEAMASGKPILGFREGAIVDLVEHGVHGYLADPGNDEDLLAGLHYCIEHKSSLGANSQERARQFTWERVAEQVAHIYHQATIIEPPTCSIVIPSYNYSSKVSTAIHSAQSQDYPFLEKIVVVDDGSTDDGATQHIVEEIAQSDPRIHYVRIQNSGVANARNFGISLTDSKYICPLDADDAIEPSFLSALIPSLESDPSLGIAYSPILLVSDRIKAKSRWPNQYNYDQQVAGHNQIPTCCVFRRKIWERLGGYRQRYCYPKFGVGTEDAEFWLRCGSIGYGGKLATSSPLFIYSFQTGATSSPSYHEVNWLAWHPWAYNPTLHPFASLATPVHNHPSHSVRQYDSPSISIIIPVGPGHSHMLVDALDSLEAQTYYNWEAIVINDTGSPLPSLITSAYPYVRFIDTPSPGGHGPGYARNRGIEISRSSLFLCLDADDYLQPAALEKLMAAHTLTPSLWIYGDMYLWKSSGIMEEYHTEDWDVHILWRKGIAPVTCLYLKSQWKSVGGFDETAGREDWDFHLKLAKSGYCGIHLPITLFTYRHDTGKRRNEDNIRRESDRLKKLYSEEELQMACPGCGKKRAAVPKPKNWTLKEVDEMTTGQWPLIEYTGSVTTDQLFRGRRTGRGYMFAANSNHRYQRVHPDDAAWILRFPYFKKIDRVVKADEEDRVLMASPTPVVPEKEEIEEKEVVREDEVIEDEVVKNVTNSDGIPSPSPSIDIDNFRVVDVLNGDWTAVQVREIYHQELASSKPRSTIIKWAEKQLDDLEAE